MFQKRGIFQLQRAVLGFLVISTLGFLAAFLVTNEGLFIMPAIGCFKKHKVSQIKFLFWYVL